MKKGILLFLIILLPIAADAFTGIVEINGIWYQVNTDRQEAEVFPRQDGKQYEGEIVIPTIVEYNGTSCHVTKIQDHAFATASHLTSITIPNSINSISVGAFYGCTGLTTVNLAEGISIIEEHAFSYCTSLSSINLPSSITTIGEYAFYHSILLTSELLQTKSWLFFLLHSKLSPIFAINF
ncbi:MAG: leucine-rich repeat domain-containing protein [Prevotella sp.]|nr:leucine-rich repeat domain-containing protein [Prevotella sp.]